MLELFPTYKVNPTRKTTKEEKMINEYDSYDEIIRTVYYISLYLKNKSKYSGKLYSIAFNRDNIYIKKL